jgi:gluconate 2-dehydrogenase gamma chain
MWNDRNTPGGITLRKIRVPRRQFLKAVTVAAGGAALFPACSKPPGRWRFLTEAEAETVSAISEQIIPTDQDPGAIAAGVPNFIDKQLVGPYKRYQQAYRSGIDGVNEASRSMFSAAFAALPWEKQTAVLEAMEAGKVKGPAWGSQSAATFFSLIRDHSLQGYYGSPRHGGNRNYLSYRMLGIDYPQIIGQNRYKKA